MYVVLMALLVVHMTPMGMKHQQVKLKHDLVFDSAEKCDRWLNLTGYETFEQFEDKLEKGPYAVINKKIGCVPTGREI